MAWRRIYLLRHGETDWNRRNFFRGRSDIRLSEKGREQAKAAGNALLGRKISSIYTSPVMRSLETAETVSKILGVPLNKAPELSDPDCGSWTGMDFEKAGVNHPIEFELMENSPSRLRFPGGESVVEVSQRVANFILKDLRDQEDENILLVTHNFIFQVFTMTVLGCHLDNLYNVEMDNGAISEYVRKGERAVLVKVNDNNHLEGI